ncbi:MAG: ATPase domain-containing protein [Candidatus Aenigmatarchaeota archaeon]|nr:RAD55 family ATPase [Candidatus Aenigmarchaeota archaeon]
MFIPIEGLDYLALTEIFIGLSFILGSWTVILSWFYENKKFLRWKTEGMKIVLGFFISIIANVLGMIIAAIYNFEIGYIINLFGLLILIISMIYAIRITIQMTRLESFAIFPTNKKTETRIIPLESKERILEKTGVPCIDKLIKGQLKREPIVIFGTQGTHPWRLAQHFALEGLVNGEAVIYLTTSKPPEQVIEQFNWLCQAKNLNFEDYKQNLAIIDCFTPFAGFGKFKTKFDFKKEKYIYEDADLRDLNDIYITLDNIRNKFENKKIRVIYDNFSSLIEFSDPELIHQFLLHQIAIEEKYGYMSLYIVRKPSDLECLQYLVSNIIKLEIVENQRSIEILKLSVPYRPGIFAINELDEISMRISKPKFIRDYTALDHTSE